MGYKKIIAMINSESELDYNVMKRAEQYGFSGADELYVYNYSRVEIERDEFLTLLKKINQSVDLPLIAGMYIGRFEDAKKAFYAGADKIVIRYDVKPEDEVIDEIVARFGRDKVMFEIHAKEEFEELNLPVDTYMIKHVDAGEVLNKRLEVTGRQVIIRDSLRRNDLEDLLNLSQVNGVATDYYANKSMATIKNKMKEEGVPVNTFESAVSFDEFVLNDQGLIPCIVQDYKTDEVLMMAYMNRESFEATLTSGKMTYYSRSRQELWCKGDTSGHYQYVKKLMLDCDKDTLLAKVHQIGSACHTGNRTCFFTELAKKDYNDVNPLTIFAEDYETIVNRKENPKEGSYTNYLFDKGIDKILKKVGEEATEIVIASKNPDLQELRYEIADFMYHLMVLMVERGLSWDDITEELAARHSDDEEKEGT